MLTQADRASERRVVLIVYVKCVPLWYLEKVIHQRARSPDI